MKGEKKMKRKILAAAIIVLLFHSKMGLSVEHIPSIHMSLTRDDVLEKTPLINNGIPHPLFVRLSNLVYRYGRSNPMGTNCRVVMGVDPYSSSFYIFHFEGDSQEPHFFGGGGQPGCDGKWLFEIPTDVCYYYLHWNTPSEDRYYIHVTDVGCATVKYYTYYSHRYDYAGHRLDDYVVYNGMYGQNELSAPVSISLLTTNPPSVIVLDAEKRMAYNYSLAGNFNYQIDVDHSSEFTPKIIRSSQFTTPHVLIVCGSTGSNDVLVKYQANESSWTETASLYPPEKVLDIAYSTTYGFLILTQGGNIYCEHEGSMLPVGSIGNIAQADDRFLRMGASADRMLLATEYTSDNGLREFSINNIIVSVIASNICPEDDNKLYINCILPIQVTIGFEDCVTSNFTEIASYNLTKGMNTYNVPYSSVQNNSQGKFIVRRYSGQDVIEQVESEPVKIYSCPDIVIDGSTVAIEECANRYIDILYSLEYPDASYIEYISLQYFTYPENNFVASHPLTEWSLGQNVAHVRTPFVEYQSEQQYTINLMVRTSRWCEYYAPESVLTVIGCSQPPPPPGGRPSIIEGLGENIGNNEYLETVLNGKVSAVIDRTRESQHIHYVVRAKNYTQLRIYDLRGRRVDPNVTVYKTGDYVIAQIDSRSIPSGVYLIAGSKNRKTVAKIVNIR